MRGRESYAEPLDVYAAARSRGMDFVTISDHNTLNGSLAIAHLPGTFVSTEFDTWFPEDGCRVHVVALGIDERTFAAAERARASVHDLVACLREAAVKGLLAAVVRGDCEPAGADGDARLLAHSIYTAAFWRLREILRLDEAVPRQRPLKLIRKGFGRIGRDVPLLEKAVRGVRSIAPGLYRDGDGRGPAWEALLEREIGSLLGSPDGLNAVEGPELNRRIFTVAQRLADDVVNLHLQPLVDPSVHVGRKRWLQSAFAVGMVHFLQLPYFIAWSVQSLSLIHISEPTRLGMI